jgi:hypothetical protein
MDEEQIKNLITELLKGSIQNELRKIIPSRGYDGRLKPITGSGFTKLSNRINTGTLYNSIDVFFQSDMADGDVELIVDFGVAEYGYWVDNGRRGRLQGAKYPPLAVIQQWARQRKVGQFRDKQGRFISNKSRDFLLQRSIGEYGIYKTDFVNKGVNNVLDNVIYYLGVYAQQFLTQLLEDKKVILRTGPVSRPITL